MTDFGWITFLYLIYCAISSSATITINWLIAMIILDIVFLLGTSFERLVETEVNKK